MRSDDWIKLDPKNLPNHQRMLVCNGVQSWAVDAVYNASKQMEARGDVFAHTDDHHIACALTHWAPIARPWPAISDQVKP